MSTSTQFQQILNLMARTKAALDKIAAGGGLTSGQADTVIAGMTVIATQAESLAGTSPLSITSVLPNPVSVGADVTITGAGFGTATGAVAFNGMPGTVKTWTDTSILVTVPGPAVSATGPVTVITNAGGNVVFPSLTVQ
jgi:hypothetical protein